MVIFSGDFSELERAMADLQKQVEAIDGQHIPFNDLFAPNFMAEYTDCSSIDELFERGGFTFESQEDFQRIPDHQLDQLVLGHTRFSSWEEMMQTAGQEWAKRQFGL